MGLSIPNTADAAYPAQAAPDSREFDAMVAGDNATYVVTGCVTTFHSAGANMSVDVTSGAVASTGTGAYVTAGTLTIGAAHASLDRFDLVVASSAGVLSVVAGTAAASPAFPTISAGSVLLASVYVPATVTSITAAMVTDKRIVQTNGLLFDERAALKNFRAAQGKVSSRSMDVLLVGTSLTEGFYATTDTTRWSYLFAKAMQAALNPPGAPGGEGYVPAVRGTTSASSYGTAAIPDRTVLSGGAVAQRSSTDPYGLGRRSIYLGSSTSQGVFTTSVCDRFWVLFASGAGTGNLSISVDGGAAVLVPTYNATVLRSGRIWDSGALTRGTHTITWKADNTATAPANIYSAVVEGVMMFDGDGAAGPANMLTPEWANIDGNYDPVASGQFWNRTSNQTNCSVATTTAQAFQGTKSLAMTCTGGANPGYVSGYLQCAPNARITFSLRARSAVTARSRQALINFYTANADGSVGAYAGVTLAGTAVADTTSGWTTISVTGEVPSNAGWMVLIDSIVGTPAASEVHYADGFDLGLTAYNGAGVINTTYQDPNSGAAQGRGVRVWEGGHAGYQASDFNGIATVGNTYNNQGMWLDCIDAVNPDLILIEFFTNESVLGTLATTGRDNLKALVSNVRARCMTVNPSIVLLAFNPTPTVAGNAAWTAQDGYRDQIRALARSLGVGFCDIGAAFPTTYKPDELGTASYPQPNVHDLLYEDGIHLTDAGQPQVMQTLLAYLLQGAPRTTVTAPVNNYAATTDPAATNDITQGFGVGSEWDNTTKRITWKCADPTANAAVWEQVKRGPLGSLTSPAVTSSTTETVLLTGSVFANAWYSGEHIDFELIGLSSSTGTIIFKVHVGTAGTTSDALAATFTTSAAQVANQRAGVRGKIQCRTTGSSGTVYVDGLAFAGTALLPLVTGAAATATVNTTVAQKITVTGTCSSGTFTAELGQIG